MGTLARLRDKSAAQILDHFDLTQFFHAVHGSELDGRLSDKGELIAHILESENLDPGATLIVGDRSHDIIGGKGNESALRRSVNQV